MALSGAAYVRDEEQVPCVQTALEALGFTRVQSYNAHIPIIASDKVGSAADMVAALETGAVFSLSAPDGLSNAIHEVEKNYETMARRVADINWNSRVETQLKAYTSLLD